MQHLPKSVVVIGPESTGKSTLTKQLASHFNSYPVEEYARTYLENLNRPYIQPDLLTMALGQLEAESAARASNNQWVFCDTNLEVIKVWSESKYGTCDERILQLIAGTKYDFYILTDIDMPWQDDPLREHPEPEMRVHFFNIYKDIVLNSNLPFVLVKGDEAERLEMAVDWLNGF